MDELINQVTQRAGISQEQAKVAVDTVVTYLKSQLPAPLASQVDGVLSGGGSLGSMTDQASGALGGLFGKK